jgi:uncharacterized membrane protein YphA (DoxX/SURF4 family)
MISYNDLFVSSIALIGSAAALAVGIGPWRNPYRLRSIAGIVDRYGMTAARGVWIFVAVISLIAGIAIASGIRPGYAQPNQGSIGSAR